MKIIPDAFSARHNLGQIHNLLVEKIWGEYMSSTGTKGGVKGNNIDLLINKKKNLRIVNYLRFRSSVYI